MVNGNIKCHHLDPSGNNLGGRGAVAEVQVRRHNKLKGDTNHHLSNNFTFVLTFTFSTLSFMPSPYSQLYFLLLKLVSLCTLTYR